MDQTEQQLQSAFNNAYRASFSPEVRAMMALGDINQRENAAFTLATSGVAIDTQIMIQGLDPYFIMKMRTDYGYTWVPNALQANVAMAPGLNTPNLTPYDPLHAPAGSIMVSLDLADYPPYKDQTLQVPEPDHKATSDYIGPRTMFQNNNVYGALLHDPTSDGTVVRHEGNEMAPAGVYIKHKTSNITPFGVMVSEYYQKVG